MKDFKEINDNELIYLIRNGNEEAYEILIDKYKYVIIHLLNEFTKNIDLIGMEKIDLYQECLVGFLDAVRYFDISKDVTFYTYATKCVKNNLLSSLRTIGRKKSMILNSSYSLDKILSENSEYNLYEIIKDESTNPNKLLIEAEEENETLTKILDCCSEREATILRYKLLGLSNSEICKLMDLDKKQIENSLFRIGKKYKKLLSNE